MFEKFKNMTDQIQMAQKLMKDENFRNFMMHPKVQELFLDEEFKEVARTRDFSKIMSHPKFTELMKDPELSNLMIKINPQSFLR